MYYFYMDTGFQSSGRKIILYTLSKIIFIRECFLSYFWFDYIQMLNLVTYFPHQTSWYIIKNQVLVRDHVNMYKLSDVLTGTMKN